MFRSLQKSSSLLTRSDHNFTTYTFSLTLTAPGLDRVGQVWKIPPVKVFFSSLLSLPLLLLAFFLRPGDIPNTNGLTADPVGPFC